jgi:hypothetical protein
MEEIEILAAERGIRNLLALYPQYADDDRYADWANLFTEEGVLEIGTQRVVRHNELESWLVTVQEGANKRHLMLNAAIVVHSSRTAQGTMDMLLLEGKGEHWAIRATVRYQDRYEKVGSEWKFASRALEYRHPSISRT